MAEHDAAVREYVERARAIDAARWVSPRGEGKWTPAQETQHLILTYQEFLRQMLEGTPIRLRGNPFQRLVWRAVGLTSMLWFRRVPVAVRTVREVRPDEAQIPAATLIPALESRVATFHDTFEHKWNEGSMRLTHPYMGSVSLDQGIRFLTVHTRHHAAFLPPLPGRTPQ